MANIEQMLHKLLLSIAKEQNFNNATVEIQATSSERASSTSILYKAIISAPNKKQLQLFAKVGNLTEETRKVIPSFIFHLEQFVYRDLAEIFKSIELKAEIPDEHRFFFPKVYGYNPNLYEETIVLENLSARGYVAYDRFKSVDWSYASKAVENLAKFHALAMAYEEQNPEEYHKLLNKLTNLIDPVYKTLGDNFDEFISTAVAAAKTENKERLLKYFNKIVETYGNVFQLTKPKRKAVLINSDYWPSNIMYKVNEDGTINVISVDYQTIRSGCVASDLLFFIFGGSDAEFRSKYYQRLVDHYYDSLSQSLQRLKLDPDKLYPREDFDYDLQETLPYGLVSALLLLPGVTAESQHAPDLNDGALQSLARPTTSTLYVARLNGVLDDFINWGIL